MNKKGQVINQMGLIISVFIVALVGLIFLQSSAQQVGDVTNTITLVNESFASASEGNSIYLTDYRAISGVVIYNETGTLVPAANYTVTNNALDTSGLLSVQITTAAINAYANDTWNISGTAQPETYAAEGGARALASIIILLFAVGLVVIIIIPTTRGKLAEIVKFK